MAMQEQFPWWEQGKPSNFFSRVVVPTRPLLILALFLGTVVFTIDTSGNASDLKNSPLSASSTASGGSGTGGTTVGDNAALVGIPPRSLLASLFGEHAIDPLFKVPTIAPQQKTTAGSGLTIPEEEPQRAIWRYLVDASNIGFEANASKLGLALATAEQGEFDALNAFIVSLETQLLTFSSLIPPQELQEAHSASIVVLERYIAHLRTARDKALGSVEETWSSPERDALAEEAGRINQQIREIVHIHNVVLPPGVLP